MTIKKTGNEKYISGDFCYSLPYTDVFIISDKNFIYKDGFKQFWKIGQNDYSYKQLYNIPGGKYCFSKYKKWIVKKLVDIL